LADHPLANGFLSARARLANGVFLNWPVIRQQTALVGAVTVSKRPILELAGHPPTANGFLSARSR
jgi:hypothetical protein